MPQLLSDRYERCIDEDAKQAWQRARQALAEDRPGAALADLRSCVRACPRNVPFHIAYQDAAFSLPEVEQDGGKVPAPQTKEMLEYYGALEDDGRSPVVPYVKARLQRLADRLAPAQKLLDLSLERDPLFYFGNYELGLIWRSIGRAHQAVGFFRKAVDTRPSFLDSRLQLAECYAELWEWPRAVDQYRTYLDRRPDDLVALRAYLTLIVYRVEGRLDEARLILLRLMQAGGDDLSLQMDNAALSWKEGKLELAIRLYRHILAIDHGYARAALNLGNLHFEIARTSESLERRNALVKARNAYRYYHSLGKATDAYDWFDLNLATRARLREIDGELGNTSTGTVSWRDL